ncbi:coproporphyrinogen III oxidase [Thalassotalea insulae]|uniref:Coproporphyrinogen III oxidase n=1 Tax=Thalassotalea insulae TaxID=2056778 RepID=A0ABQ6GTJ7_9GAMM|nr:DUF2489 domain-containing protein [Thalassotalea insulae]GLX78664.1 coproporphyrinogen III oxidase [Thalassotalea insulae]
MIVDYWPYWLAFACMIVISLAVYAGKLLRQLKHQTERQQQLTLQQQQALATHDKKILDSVVIIVRAMKEEQCDISEGCWRLSVLLDSLKTADDLSLQFPAIFELYGAIKHMPILEERKQLSKQQRMKFDLERTKVEARLQPSVFQAIEELHNYALAKIGALSNS